MIKEIKSNNSNLSKAKKAKDDEFYTQLFDIENEIKHYKEHFRDKIVYCNCDDPEWSNFFIYFKNNFNHLGLKKLISTHYSLNIEKDKAYKLECVEYSIDENGTPKETKSYLDGNGDFRSQECINLLEESDIVCTNPPFSLFREYIAQLMEYDKKFLIIGSMNAITYKETFNLIMNEKIWLGNTNVKKFRKPNGEIKNFGNICWYTNLSHKKRNEEIILWKEYNEEEYPLYDNYNAIEVSKVANIPKDYNGYMAVPITFLEKFNPHQFMICDANNIKTNKDIKNKPHGLIKDKEGTVNGKIKYVRFIIKRINK